jgi:hypothetical protein
VHRPVYPLCVTASAVDRGFGDTDRGVAARSGRVHSQGFIGSVSIGSTTTGFPRSAGTPT